MRLHVVFRMFIATAETLLVRLRLDRTSRFVVGSRRLARRVTFGPYFKKSASNACPAHDDQRD